MIKHGECMTDDWSIDTIPPSTGQVTNYNGLCLYR